MHICDAQHGIDVKLTDPLVWRDPYPLYARLRENAPLVRCREPFGGEAWLLSRYDDVATVLKDTERFKNDVGNTTGETRPYDRVYIPKIFKAFARSMIFVDGLDHQRLRNLAMRAFTTVRVNSLENRIERIAAALLNDAAGRKEFDLIADFALPLPLRIISEMLGVSADERKSFHATLQRVMTVRDAWHIVLNTPTFYSLYRFFKRLLDRKRSEPGDDLTSALIEAEEEGDRLTPEELMGTVFLLLFAGHETTVNLIGNGTLALLENPDELTCLRANPSLLADAVEEMLRYYSPAHTTQRRHVAKSCSIGSVDLKKGDVLAPLVGAANRDERAFENAGTFNVRRTPNKHLAFGAGPHFCIGAHLSRLEGRIAFGALLNRFTNFRLAIDRSKLRWRSGIGALRGLEALPIVVD
jgi:cytochrome P450